MPLSVVLALARLNLDPWQEAAELSELPKETAAATLETLIARLPADPRSLLQGGKAREHNLYRAISALVCSAFDTRS